MRMYKREVPKMNKENLSIWKNKMRPHLSGIGNNVTHWLDHQHVAPTPTMIVEEMS